jgi:hypothetical protein
MWAIFVDNILPIFLCAGAGFVVGRRLKPELKTASRLAFYIFSPCLVFTSILHTELSGGEFGQLALFTLGVLGVMGLIALTTGAVMRLDRPTLAALIVASVFVNGGNYGLALNQFAFGQTGMARAVVYYVFSTLTVYTFGVVVASAGRKPIGHAFRQVLSVPAAYALLIAGGMKLTHLSLPLFLDRPVTLLSQAAIPVMLVILGLQMAEARTGPRARLGLIGVACFLQLVIAPLVGLGLAWALGLHGITRQAAVLEAAMPTAVITTILAVEYDLDAAFMTSTVILSTLLSPLTLTPLIAYLR